MKEKFLELLRSTNREGIEDLIKFMEESTDFFTAPASTRFHGDHEGGLLEHSLKVYEILNEKLKHTPIEMNIPDDTIKIAALLHDICKVNFYKVSYRNAKNELGVWEKVPYYTIEDTIPYLDNIFRAPNRFIINEEEVVKIERARRITVESIKNLSRNTNFIQEVDKKTGDVKPSKILNIDKEESYDTYENRLIYTLIQNMKYFVSIKKKN